MSSAGSLANATSTVGSYASTVGHILSREAWRETVAAVGGYPGIISTALGSNFVVDIVRKRRAHFREEQAAKRVKTVESRCSTIETAYLKLANKCATLEHERSTLETKCTTLEDELKQANNKMEKQEKDLAELKNMFSQWQEKADRGKERSHRGTGPDTITTIALDIKPSGDPKGRMMSRALGLTQLDTILPSIEERESPYDSGKGLEIRRSSTSSGRKRRSEEFENEEVEAPSPRRPSKQLSEKARGKQRAVPREEDAAQDNGYMSNSDDEWSHRITTSEAHKMDLREPPRSRSSSPSPTPGPASWKPTFNRNTLGNVPRLEPTEKSSSYRALKRLRTTSEGEEGITSVQGESSAGDRPKVVSRSKGRRARTTSVLASRKSMRIASQEPVDYNSIRASKKTMSPSKESSAQPNRRGGQKRGVSEG